MYTLILNEKVLSCPYVLMVSDVAALVLWDFECCLSLDILCHFQLLLCDMPSSRQSIYGHTACHCQTSVLVGHSPCYLCCFAAKVRPFVHFVKCN